MARRTANPIYFGCALDSALKAAVMTEISIDEAIRVARDLHQAGRRAEAEKIYHQILEQQPDHSEALHLLGMLAGQKGQLETAVELIRRAIEVAPDYANAHYNLGVALRGMGRLDEAIESYRQAVRLSPEVVQAHYDLGIALESNGQIDDAVAAYREAIRLKPDYAAAHVGLGMGLKAKGQLDAAIESYREAIRIKSDLVEAHSDLGNALKEMGELDEAIVAYRESIRIKPDYVHGHSGLCYVLHFHPAYDARMIFEEHRRWNQLHAEPLKKFIQPYNNNRDPDRRLRIGYVSPDFRGHPVGRFLLSLFAAHDAERFEVFCYSDVQRPDGITERLRTHAHQWRNLVGLGDEQACKLIRADKIDILVDLTMHMAKNRLLLFARKPAPVQVTYLAYCSTTGLDAIDYRLTDSHLDPAGMSDEFYSEKSVRLPETYWCYPLHDESPEVSPLPALDAGYVTFGCLNNFCKVTPNTLETWARLLQAVPGARLLLYAPAGRVREKLMRFMEERVIARDRVELVGFASPRKYFETYHRIDIGLDPFPCVGGTTTCDAIWMGVPLVTLAGQTAVGRAGVSILANLDLRELVAETPELYVQIAAGLATDLPRLAELRGGLRSRILASPLMDAPRFARGIEAAYRQMWRDWCATGNG